MTTVHDFTAIAGSVFSFIRLFVCLPFVLCLFCVSLIICLFFVCFCSLIQHNSENVRSIHHSRTFHRFELLFNQYQVTENWPKRLVCPGNTSNVNKLYTQTSVLITVLNTVCISLEQTFNTRAYSLSTMIHTIDRWWSEILEYIDATFGCHGNISGV